MAYPFLPFCGNLLSNQPNVQLYVKNKLPFRIIPYYIVPRNVNGKMLNLLHHRHLVIGYPRRISDRVQVR
jgi:hypothetical protein